MGPRQGCRGARGDTDTNVRERGREGARERERGR